MREIAEQIAEQVVSILDGDADVHVLDAACGIGQLSAAIARKLPECTCTGIDICAKSIADAQKESDLANVKFEVANMQSVNQADGAYDVIVSQQGLQYVDSAKATAEFARLLKPLGTVIASVWGRPSNCAVLALPIEMRKATVDAAATEASEKRDARHSKESVAEAKGEGRDGIGDPFCFADPTRLQGILEEAGFINIQIETWQAEICFKSFESYWGWVWKNHRAGGCESEAKAWLLRAVQKWDTETGGAGATTTNPGAGETSQEKILAEKKQQEEVVLRFPTEYHLVVGNRSFLRQSLQSKQKRPRVSEIEASADD
jgi:ubiquinone/menaquinone biosynthesis C-methylase UbiE